MTAESEESFLTINNADMKRIYDDLRAYIDAQFYDSEVKQAMKRDIDNLLRMAYKTGRSDERYFSTKGPHVQDPYEK